jgi:hypothetical protein
MGAGPGIAVARGLVDWVTRSAARLRGSCQQPFQQASYRRCEATNNDADREDRAKLPDGPPWKAEFDAAVLHGNSSDFSQSAEPVGRLTWHPVQVPGLLASVGQTPPQRAL